MAERIYVPGDLVEESGVYLVSHDPSHCPPHAVTCQAEDLFVPCRACGMAVRFRLQQAVPHLREHECLR